jgi:uncharacterized membrane protein HdeD (DUF308 family)
MTVAPPKKSNNWIWTVVRGLIALALGIFLISGDDSARVIVAYALSAYLAIAGAMQTFSSLLNRGAPGSMTDRLRGLVGLIGGLVLIALLYFNVLQVSAAYTILAILVIVFGVLGLFESFFDRGGKHFSWMPVVVNALLLLLGVLIFYSRSRETFDLQLWAGVILALMGVGLMAYAYLVQKPKPELSAANI